MRPYAKRLASLRGEGAALQTVFGIGRVYHIAFWKPHFAAEFTTEEEWKRQTHRAWQEVFRGDGFDFDYHFMWDHYKDPDYVQAAAVLYRDLQLLAEIGLNGFMSGGIPLLDREERGAIETEVKRCRVFLDFRTDPGGFDAAGLSAEPREYLARSGAMQETPLARFLAMNPAVELYREHGIDLAAELLEIAVCAQHSNGGLAGDIWWESANLKHLFPIGEINGAHGVYRPGGTALNAGQAGGFRAAELIAHRYSGRTLDEKVFANTARTIVAELFAWCERSGNTRMSWRDERAAFQARMTEAGGPIRNRTWLAEAAGEAREQWRFVAQSGCGYEGRAVWRRR